MLLWPIIFRPGFYIHSKFFPVPRLGSATTEDVDRLLLGPFCGKPACQYIQVDPTKARGVCAGAYLQRQTLVIADVDSYPGHIACDGDTKSEIVIPLILDVGGESYALGVLDLDCLALNGFDDEDKVGLEKITTLLVNGCDW
jgi:L-methionine (R)-S-oxide reductase